MICAPPLNVWGATYYPDRNENEEAAMIGSGRFLRAVVVVLAAEIATIGAASAQQNAEIDIASIVEMSQGAADAPVTIVEYASFTCPHCATFHEGPYKSLKADYIDTGKVRLIYRDVYFDRYGLWASMMARCTGPKAFFGIVDQLYASQSEWTGAGGDVEIVTALRKIGLRAGIGADTLESCLQDGEKARALVTWYQKNAEADGIDATPTFVINGIKVPNQSYEGFRKIIEAELAIAR
jgi:protein-disulfide isomerase